MKKMNQQSINKIIFYKLFENINDPIQNATLNSSKVSDTSMSSMNPLPLKSDTPTPSPDQIEYEEYKRWLEQQMHEWQKANPPPIQTDGMTHDEWLRLTELWWFEYELYADDREQWYILNTGDGVNPPLPDTRPERRPREPTWSPKPEWAPPYLPGWWHIGPNETGPV
jgi:hypothetical protein